MRAFLEAAGGNPSRPKGIALADRLAAETDGNPFFVTEVLRHLVETGALVQVDGVWVGTVAPGEAGLPEGVRDVVGQRLSRLSPETNDLLRTAAVFGREFEVDLVAAVMQVDEDTAVDHLDEAVAAQLVDEVEGSPGPSELRPRARPPDAARGAHHQQAGPAAPQDRRAARRHDRARPIEVLAHHYLEAAVSGVADRAIECAREAALAASARMAYEDALALYERAPRTRRRRPGLAGRAPLGDGLRPPRASGTPSWPTTARSKPPISPAELGDAASLANAGIAYQGELGVWASPTDPVGAEIIREGLAMLGTERPDVRARALSALAHGLILSPGAEALPAADDAIAAAREAGDDQAFLHALDGSRVGRSRRPSRRCPKGRRRRRDRGRAGPR